MKEQELYTTDMAEFSDLTGDTAVGRMIETLSPTTSPDVVTQLATLSEEEKTRLNTLEKSLRESDPKRKAETLRRLKTRIDRFHEILRRFGRLVH